MKIVNAAPKDKDLLFVPDENLGAVGDGADRPADDVVEGQLLRARRVPARQRAEAAASNFPTRRWWFIPESLREVRDLADAVCSTEKMITYCKTESGEAIHHRDRIGHHPPDAEGMSGQGIPLRADVRRDARADGQLPLQRVQIHEDEHARKGARLHEKPRAAHRIAAGNPASARGCRLSGCWRFRRSRWRTPGDPG